MQCMYMYLTGTELEMQHLQKLYENSEWTPPCADIAWSDRVKDVSHAGQKRKASQGKRNIDAKLNKKKATKGKLLYIMVTVRTTNLEVLVTKIISTIEQTWKEFCVIK